MRSVKIDFLKLSLFIFLKLSSFICQTHQSLRWPESRRRRHPLQSRCCFRPPWRRNVGLNSDRCFRCRPLQRAFLYLATWQRDTKLSGNGILHAVHALQSIIFLSDLLGKARHDVHGTRAVQDSIPELLVAFLFRFNVQDDQRITFGLRCGFHLHLSSALRAPLEVWLSLPPLRAARLFVFRLPRLARQRQDLWHGDGATVWPLCRSWLEGLPLRRNISGPFVRLCGLCSPTVRACVGAKHVFGGLIAPIWHQSRLHNFTEKRQVACAWQLATRAWKLVACELFVLVKTSLIIDLPRRRLGRLRACVMADDHELLGNEPLCTLERFPLERKIGPQRDKAAKSVALCTEQHGVYRIARLSNSQLILVHDVRGRPHL